jgi:hypothetical protein
MVAYGIVRAIHIKIPSVMVDVLLQSSKPFIVRCLEKGGIVEVLVYITS